LDHLLSLLNSTAKVGAISTLGKSKSNLPLVHPIRSHSRAFRGVGCVMTTVWQKAWWWVLVAIVLTAPILMLTGHLY